MKRYCLLAVLLLSACAKRELVHETKPKIQRNDREMHASALKTAQPATPSSPEEWGETFFKKGD